jgi:hypothetical protein
MKLTKEQQQKLIEKLNELWKNQKVCSICQGQNWNVSDTVFELREFHGGNMVIGGSAIIPVLTLTCTKCGQTIFLNAMSLGIVELPQHKEGGVK